MMSSYIESNLSKDEVIVKRAELHHLPILIFKALGALFVLLSIVTMISSGFGLGLLVLIITVLPIGLGILAIRSMELCFTNKRLIGKTGLISTHRLDVPLNKADSVAVTRGLGGRILGYGVIVVSSMGASKVNFQFIKDPEAFRRDLLEEIERFDEDRIKKQATEMMGAMQNNMPASPS